MADLTDILHKNEEQLTDDELLKYLHENIPADEKHLIEKKILDNPFDSDAIQGLSQLKDKKVVKKHVNQLNQKLQQLTLKKSRKEKRNLKVIQWIILSVLILLFLCFASYFLLIKNL